MSVDEKLHEKAILSLKLSLEWLNQVSPEACSRQRRQLGLITITRPVRSVPPRRDRVPEALLHASTARALTISFTGTYLRAGGLVSAHPGVKPVIAGFIPRGFLVAGSLNRSCKESGPGSNPSNIRVWEVKTTSHAA